MFMANFRLLKRPTKISWNHRSLGIFFCMCDMAIRLPWIHSCKIVDVTIFLSIILQQQNGTSDIHLSPELKDVELRRPHPQNVGTRLSHTTSSGARNSVAVLRQSLMNAENPYTLWPSTAQQSAGKVRFLVTPVAEEPPSPLNVPTSPTRRRVSKFLQDPCVILRETPCWRDYKPVFRSFIILSYTVMDLHVKATNTLHGFKTAHKALLD